MNDQRYNGPVVLKMWSLDEDISITWNCSKNTNPSLISHLLNWKRCGWGLAVGVLISLQVILMDSQVWNCSCGLWIVLRIRLSRKMDCRSIVNFLSLSLSFSVPLYFSSFSLGKGTHSKSDGFSLKLIFIMTVMMC